MLVADVLFSEAVTVALPFEVKVPAAAVNVALADPAATLTEAGTVIDVLLDDNATVAPVVPLRPTVQILDPPEPTVAGEHAKLLIVNEPAATTEPPAPVTEMLLALGPAPMALVMPIADVPAAGDVVTRTVATTPLAMLASVMPAAMQL